MTLSPKRVLAARALAIVVDAAQIGLIPLFVEGGISIVNDVVDVVVAIVMVLLVGWHWTFLPAFLAEMVPFFDLAPTWTAAVFIATRGGAPPEEKVAALPPPPPSEALEPRKK